MTEALSFIAGFIACLLFLRRVNIGRRRKASNDAKAVCHKEQLDIWSGDFLGALSIAGHISEDLEYHEVIDAHSVAQDEIKKIVESAFSHPELLGVE